MSTRNQSDAAFYGFLIVILCVALVAVSTLLLGHVKNGEPVEIGTAIAFERPTCEEA
jgi:Flp pilus assembly pilin Flp